MFAFYIYFIGYIVISLQQKVSIRYYMPLRMLQQYRSFIFYMGPCIYSEAPAVFVGPNKTYVFFSVQVNTAEGMSHYWFPLTDDGASRH